MNKCNADINFKKEGDKMSINKSILDFTENYGDICKHNDYIPQTLFDEYGVQRGLRDKNGNGVLTGLTNISRIEAFQKINGEKVPCEGKLWYRGYNVLDLVRDFSAKRFGYEETAYLLLFGELPNNTQLEKFKKVLGESRTLPTNFTRDVIMKAPSHDIMNSLTKSVLTLAAYDDNAAAITEYVSLPADVTTRVVNVELLPPPCSI